MADDNTIVFENARIAFRNFAGKEGKYNAAGQRNFCLLLEPELAEQMANDGWNIKLLKERDEGEPRQAYLEVTVGYKGRPPRVVMITSRGRTDLGEDEVEVMDWADIANVDLIIRPYNWQVNDASGIKAYLKSMFVTINEDELELKYSDVPQAGHQSPAFEED